MALLGADVSWGFFFVASLLLNFVTLNLLLAMCVSSLENVSSQFKQDEKDKVAAQKAKDQKAQAIADQRTSSNPLLSPISSILSPLDNADGLVEDLYAQTIPAAPPLTILTPVAAAVWTTSLKGSTTLTQHVPRWRQRSSSWTGRARASAVDQCAIFAKSS